MFVPKCLPDPRGAGLNLGYQFLYVRSDSWLWVSSKERKRKEKSEKSERIRSEKVKKWNVEEKKCKKSGKSK